ncbi:MAG: 3-phosphoshikimate 1-carboxyvinyltransferase [Clostridia bacterium]|nr:3-phosphoshikimate 1-carboxyvinyltransferase [Clostridia bacterium]
MIVKIKPSHLCGSISAPPSKSMAHRLLISAGLSDGVSVVRGVAPSEDMLATIDCLAALGVRCEYDGRDVTVRGASPEKMTVCATLPCRECGSTLRFFISICLLLGCKATLSGSERLLMRPLSVYETLCRERGFDYSNDGKSITVCGKLESGDYTLRGDVSSQFVSGLLFALPTLDGDSRITLTGNVESRPYIDMTIGALEKFGVIAKWENENTLFVLGGQKYAPADITVEGDWSNAAFFHAIGGDVKVTGLDEKSAQGDKICVEYFKKLAVGSPTLPLGDCPDLGPVMFAMAAEKHGATFTGTSRLRAKESDRVASMTEELAKFGAEFEVADDAVTVKNTALGAPAETLSSHGDHRVAMALSVLMTKYGGTLTGAEAVKKSMPDFYERIASLGADVEKHEDK